MKRVLHAAVATLVTLIVMTMLNILPPVIIDYSINAIFTIWLWLSVYFMVKLLDEIRN